MGQQQLMLIVLSVILVGIALAVGIGMFKSHAITMEQEAIIQDIVYIANYGFQYKTKPFSLAGGNGTYEGFTIPDRMASNSNAIYGALVLSTEGEGSNNVLQITGVSARNENASITAFYDLSHNLVGAPESGAGSFPGQGNFPGPGDFPGQGDGVVGGTSEPAGFVRIGWD